MKPGPVLRHIIELIHLLKELGHEIENLEDDEKKLLHTSLDEVSKLDFKILKEDKLAKETVALIEKEGSGIREAWKGLINEINALTQPFPKAKELINKSGLNSLRYGSIEMILVYSTDLKNEDSLKLDLCILKLKEYLGIAYKACLKLLDTTKEWNEGPRKRIRDIYLKHIGKP